MLLDLCLKHVDRVILDLVGGLKMGHKEIGFLVELKDFKVLRHAVHCRAGVRLTECIQEFIAALNGSLQDGTAELTGVVRHVIGCNVDGTGAWSSQSCGEALIHIQENFRDVIACIAKTYPSVILCLLDQLIVRVVKKVFEKDHVFQIFHKYTSLFHFNIPSLSSADAAP